MSNNAFHNLVYEFELNMSYNEDFHKYAMETYSHTPDPIYGNEQFSMNDMKAAKKGWKQKMKKDTSLFWFKNSDDIDKWLEE